MSKKAKGWEVKVHPHHVAAVDALTGKVKLGTKARPPMSNRTIATLLALDMKTVKALKEDKEYRERVLARKGPLAPSKEDASSPVLADLADLRERVKALEQPAAQAEPEATEAVSDSIEGVQPETDDAPPGGTPGEPDGGGEGERETTETPAEEIPAGTPEGKGPLDGWE